MKVVSLFAGLVSSVNGNIANDVCKVLTLDQSAVCKEERFCYKKNRKSWSPMVKTKSLCGNKALVTLEDVYATHVEDLTSMFLLPHHRRFATQLDCGGFVELFGKKIGEFLSTVAERKAFRCSPMDMSNLVDSATGATALRGVLNMYRAFPLGEKLMMLNVDLSFLIQLEAAKVAFPIQIATGEALADGGPPKDHTIFLLTGSRGRKAEELLLLKAGEPVHLTFSNVIDRLMQIHSHVLTPPATSILSPNKRKIPFTEIKYTVPYSVTQFVVEADDMMEDEAAVKVELRHASNKLVLVALDMIDEMNTDTQAIIKEHAQYLLKVEGQLVRKDPAYEKTHADIIAARKAWNKDHYKNILIYLIYLHSNSIVSFDGTQQIWATA